METVIVTCGPGFEPIDEARRLTNMSTGELGVLLSERLAAAGHKVLCFKGSGATWPDPRGNVEVKKFDTNNDLHILFQQAAKDRKVSTIFHTAALCDYKVKTVTNETGSSIRSKKIPTSGGNIFLELEPSLKVLPLLRSLFPTAKIIGWKYELSGTREDALARAKRQIEIGKTDACVVNGKAFGPGFGFYTIDQPLSETNTKLDLVEFLVQHTSPSGKPTASLSEIRNFIPINEKLLTGGMPRPEHFPVLAHEKVEVVINLALPTSDNAIPNEGDLVTMNGMTYFHIPVKFDAPTAEDYYLFEEILKSVANRKVFVHCAANMRVSAFLFLFHRRNTSLPEETAKQLLNQIWDPEGPWRELMQRIPERQG